MELQALRAKDILSWRKKLLSEGGRPADLDWLLDIGGGLRWSDLQLIKIDQDSSSFTLEKSLEELEILWKTHLHDHTPLQYLIGRCPWRDFELEVSKAALIPRQETELLVDIALRRVGISFMGCWADLGTGSGALAIALARFFPKALGHAVDCSKDALSLAERNLIKLAPKAKVKLHLGDWWEPLEPWWGEIGLVVANPPYIPNRFLEALEPAVFDHEPHLALCGGEDGLIACRKVVFGAIKALQSKGWLILEHHFDQSDAVLGLMRKAGLKEIGFETDLEGVKRFAICRKP